MPADDLSLAIRIRADVQQALDGMDKLNARLGDTDGSGSEAARSLRGLGQTALRTADAHEALRGRARAAYADMAESARAAARDQAEAGESWIDRVRAALEQIRQDSDNAADETRAVTVGAFRSMEHAVAAFATTGKVSFSGFVDSVIADLARLAARRTIVQPLAGLIAGALPGLFGGGPASGEATPSTGSQSAGVRHGGETADPRQGGSSGASPGTAARASHGHVRGSASHGHVRGSTSHGHVRGTVPPAIFDGAPRFHSGGIAGLRPEEVPVIVRRGEGIFTPEQMRAMGSPNVTVQLENRGTPQREVSRQVRVDPRGLIVAVVTDDLHRNGPIRQTLARELGRA